MALSYSSSLSLEVVSLFLTRYPSVTPSATSHGLTFSRECVSDRAWGCTRNSCNQLIAHVSSASRRLVLLSATSNPLAELISPVLNIRALDHRAPSTTPHQLALAGVAALELVRTSCTVAVVYLGFFRLWLERVAPLAPLLWDLACTGFSHVTSQQAL